MSASSPNLSPPREDTRDLGFGSVVASQSRVRLLNRDGSFNAVREGLPLKASLSPYVWLVQLSWPSFLAVVAGFYLFLNSLFALAYLALGPGALGGAPELAGQPFWKAFFFSVTNLSTIGFGHIAPVGMGAHLLMTVESILGVLLVALSTGIAFARFSRPVARLLYSKEALIAPFRSGRAFMFRVVNLRKSQLLELSAQVVFSRFGIEDGENQRRFVPLTLERQKVMFFPTSWTLVHVIDETSPFHGLTPDQALAANVEVVILMTAIDESFGEAVHSRTSYRAEEIRWNARFLPLFKPAREGESLAIDVGKLDEVEEVGEG